MFVSGAALKEYQESGSRAAGQRYSRGGGRMYCRVRAAEAGGGRHYTSTGSLLSVSHYDTYTVALVVPRTAPLAAAVPQRLAAWSH